MCIRDRNQSSGEDGLGGIGVFEEYTEEADGNAKKKAPTTASSTGETQSEGSSSSSAQGAGGSSSESDSEVASNGSNPEQDSDAEPEKEPDLPDLRKNDDIVARQIREAAEQETDPELKKKLWEEYYNYKGL